MQGGYLVDNKIGSLMTEQINPRSLHIDTMDSESIVRLMNEEDAVVATAMKEALPQIAQAVDMIVAQMKKGGRLIYVGAGTSGRLGMLDAAECPPTFGVSPDQVTFLLAGGADAFLKGIEDAEDDEEAARVDMQRLNLSKEDCVVAISASGRTPYSIAALKEANVAQVPCIAISCNKPAEMSQFANVAIEVNCGPEVLVGSTRLKAGTAQKMILNMLSTASMVRLGKAYQNLMVDMLPLNTKLKERAKYMVMTATGVTYEQAEAALKKTDWQVKTAIVLILTGASVARAKKSLERAGGFVRQAVRDLTGASGRDRA